MLAEKTQYHSKLIISEVVLSALIQTWINRREKVRGNYPWPGYHRHHVNCPSPSGGMVYMLTEGACPMVLGKDQQICGNSQQSSSCFPLLLEPCCFPYPSSGLCCCFSPEARRYCPCCRPPSQIVCVQNQVVCCIKWLFSPLLAKRTSPEACLHRRGTGWGCSIDPAPTLVSAPDLVFPWLSTVLQDESGSLAWNWQCTLHVTSVLTAFAQPFGKLHF